MIREYFDVKQEALTLKQVVRFARVHGIIVEKNYQLPESDERRKFKGRGALLGNKVKNQNWEAAFFQDLGNSPASFESSRGQTSMDVFQVTRSSLQMRSRPTSKHVSRDRPAGSSYHQTRGLMTWMYQNINDQWLDYAKLCTGILTLAQCGRDTVIRRSANLGQTNWRGMATHVLSCLDSRECYPLSLSM